MNTKPSDSLEFEGPVASLQTVLICLLGIIAGTLLAAQFLPAWLPQLSTSLLGAQPKAYWFLSRGSAIIGYLLLWMSMALGLIITNKMARVWPGGPTAFELHEYVSLLGMGFVLFHAMILMGDHFINYTLPQVLLPFASQNYRPFWVGIGQVGFYTWVLVNGSFYIRKRIGTRSWRLIHFVSFVTFAMAMAHGLASGTDSNTIWAMAMYWVTGGSLLFLLTYRILVTVGNGKVTRPLPATQTRKMK
jgi:predicted ferric reductase